MQTEPAVLRVRLRVAVGSDAERVSEAVHTQLTCLLENHRLGHVRVERADEPPAQTPGSKYRSVVPLSDS